MSQDYWMKRTGIGISFGASTCLGVLVGLLMVGQSLYALALAHAGDYATLKALGADESQVAAIIVTQSVAIACVGSLIGLAGVLAVRALWRSALAPIEMPAALVGGDVGMVFVICVAAALLPWLRVRRIDPAEALTG
jgi:putative ABC transport system permease protein